MNIVLYGEEKLLLQQKLDALKKEYHVSEEQMNLSTYHMSDSTMSEVLDDARMLPFLSDVKMVIVKEPLFLTSTRQKNVSEADVKAFIGYLGQDNPSTVFVVYHDEHNFDERKKAVKALRQHAKFFEFRRINQQQLYKSARQAVIRRGSTIDDDALDLLLERTGNDLQLVSNQVEKLCLYSDHITLHDVEVLVTPLMEEKVYKLTDAILHHDLTRSMQIYQDLMRTGSEPIMLIGAISNSLRQHYQVKLLVRKGYTDKEIVKALGLNPRAIYPIRKAAETFEIAELTRSLHDLSELDLKIKSGLVDKKRGLELFILGIHHNEN